MSTNYIKVNEEKLANLIRDAHKFNCLKYIGIDDLLDENGISLGERTAGSYYEYDDMPDEEVIEEYIDSLGRI